MVLIIKVCKVICLHSKSENPSFFILFHVFDHKSTHNLSLSSHDLFKFYHVTHVILHQVVCFLISNYQNGGLPSRNSEGFPEKMRLLYGAISPDFFIKKGKFLYVHTCRFFYTKCMKYMYVYIG